MPWDLSVFLTDEPGTIAQLTETLADAGVNLAGICGFPVGGRGLIHLLVDDPAEARRALEDAGFPIEADREVVVVECPDRPGEVASRARTLADAGINIDLIYVGTGTRLVLGVDDVARAASLLA